MPKPPHNPKLIGERAECAFMHQALERGLIVSKPFGDSAGYDVVVEGRRGKLWRVQVRSVRERNGRGYKLDTRRGTPKVKMTPLDADFLAAWVVPKNAWYIVPVKAFAPANHLSLYPHVEGSYGKWERYREAWRLLRRKRLAMLRRELRGWSRVSDWENGAARAREREQGRFVAVPITTPLTTEAQRLGEG